MIDSASGRVPVLPLVPSHRTVGVSESLSTYEGVLPCALRFAEYFTVWAQVVAGCCSDAGVAECSTDHRHIYAGA